MQIIGLYKVVTMATQRVPLPPRYVSQLGRHNYVTPTSYLELISSFKSLIGNKRGTVIKMKKRYEVGLEKLAFAASQVSNIPHTHSHLLSTV